ncbi:MAG: chitinase [Actinobacteria bacterium]|nr:chitinase [Actinomycetota bacterium]
MSTTELPSPDTAPDDLDERDDLDAPRVRLSKARLAILLLIVALVAGGVYVAIRLAQPAPAAAGEAWSIPYVDVTLTPTYQFQDPQSNPARDVALAFVVADPDEPCAPTWGGAYSLDSAAQDLELDRRIRQLRDAGGDVVVSFGGQANQELATVCEDDGLLTAAYRSVVERYAVDSIDLDIEGAAVADGPSIERRAAAIAAVQEERAAKDAPLTVWLTVPVAPSGMTAEVLDLVGATLDGGVELAGVNLMTMDFGDADHPTGDMLAATKSALEASVQQMIRIYAARQVTLTEPEAWTLLGATPMIGQNDVVGEVFTLDDARGLAEFAVAKGLGRVSMWSLNRDAPCPASFADVTVISNTCSSQEQLALDFANVFTGLPGRSPSLPPGGAVTVTDPPKVIDDPATSPYPIWRPDAQYPGTYKVVRNGMVYEAKWYTQGDDPARVTANTWESAWSLVGPVSPDDEPFTPTTVAAGTYPDWSPETLYDKGDKVLFDGLPYEARWPNQSDAPSTLFPVGPDSSWRPLFTLPGEPAET